MTDKKKPNNLESRNQMLEKLPDLVEQRRFLDLILKNQLLEYIKTETDQEKIKRIEVLIEEFLFDGKKINRGPKIAIFSRKEKDSLIKEKKLPIKK
jgi:hypothetical protein